MARLRFMSKPEQIFSPPFAWQYTTHVYEPRCSGFQFFVVTHFIAIVSPFRCWFRRIGMRPCGWLASFFHSPAVAQISDSSLKLRLSLKCCELLCCCALWNGTVRPSVRHFMWFVILNTVRIEVNFHAFFILGGLFFIFSNCIRFWIQIGVLHWKWKFHCSWFPCPCPRYEYVLPRSSVRTVDTSLLAM